VDHPPASTVRRRELDIRPSGRAPHADAFSRLAGPTFLHRPPSTGTGRKESGVMFHPNQFRTEPIVTIESGRTGACLVAGCTCKDARIVSFRRAAFFAALARQTGQTADRVIAVEDGWRISAIEGVELS
jgi:hypothetical protein